jgi:signal transduction histidine kinase
MRRRRGLQSEVLASLAAVMLTATLVLGALLARTHEANVRQLRQLAARALLADVESPLPATAAAVAELRWWRVDAAGRAHPHGVHADALDAASGQLAAAARAQGRPLLRAGPPWVATRFAAPAGDAVLVAWLPPAVPGWMLLAVLAGDFAVFTAFGATLLRGRLVRPLQRLAAAARAIAAGDLAARVPAEGPRETFELAGAFNEMTEALAARTQALEKAVADLRESNRQLRAARAGLDRAERLAAVGRLAAGVAHEVGNPMAALLGFLDLASRENGLSGAGREHLARAAREGERVRVILRQILDFSRPARSQRTPVDVGEVADETAALVRAQQRYRDVAIEVVRAGEPPLALADKSRVAQILLNLLVNAADALRGCGAAAPRVRVTLEPAALHVRADEPGARAGGRRVFDAVACSVEDNGPGVAPEDRERIFDPFFTTKPPGEGTGLGLSNAARFAEELGGALELDAAHPGPGARFVLRLPALESGAGDARARRA